uniref:Defensin-like protein n=1 Tax=Cucumis melo TaxID=3656 RepID=A0A9I9E758_CUCME
MAGEWRKLILVAFIFLAIASGWMMVETEGKLCFKRIPKFKGRCNSNAVCTKACNTGMKGICSNV